MEREELKKIIEGIIFVSDEPVMLKTIEKVLGDGVESHLIKSIIQELEMEYSASSHGIELVEVAGGYQFRTKRDISEWIKKLERFQPPKFSKSAIETLSIIAYRQPITKAEIDRIRGGVDSSGVLKTLLMKKLIKIAGRRKDLPGRPFTYGTTRKFLETFSLKDLSELPPISEEKEV